MPVLVRCKGMSFYFTLDRVAKPQLHGGQSGERERALGPWRRFEEAPDRAGVGQAVLDEAALAEETLERAPLTLEEDPQDVAVEVDLAAALPDPRGERGPHRPAEHALGLRAREALLERDREELLDD